MLSDLLAERYAKALLRAGLAEGALDALGPQAALLQRALRGPEADAFLGDPLAEPSAKAAALGSAFGGTLHPLLAAFLAEVFGNRRERRLPAMLEAFSRGRDEAEGRVRAELDTARALKPRELDPLREALGRRLKREVVLRHRADASLLGGAVLRIGDTVYDGSLRGGLRRLERRLSAEPAAPKAKPRPAAKPGPKAGRVKAKKAPRAKAASARTKKAPRAGAAAGKAKAFPKSAGTARARAKKRP